MSGLGTRRRIGLRGALSLLLVAYLLTSCTSEPSRPNATAARTIARDARLFGVWRVESVQILGHVRLTADASTTASLRFRRDGLLIVDGEKCGAPRFTTSSRHLKLHWPANTDCASFTAGSPLDSRIAGILERLVDRRPLTYAVVGKTLTLAVVHKFRVLLHRGRLSARRPSVGPTSPVRYSGSATTAAPTRSHH